MIAAIHMTQWSARALSRWSSSDPCVTLVLAALIFAVVVVVKARAHHDDHGDPDA